jgi:hypothetical protein
MSQPAPLFDLEAETRFLGGFLSLEGIDHKTALSTVRPEHLNEKPHRTVYKIILDLFKAGEPINYFTVFDRLKATETLDQAGGEHYLIHLAQSVATMTTFKEAAAKIVHCADKRMADDVLSTAKQIVANSNGEGVGPAFDHLRQYLHQRDIAFTHSWDSPVNLGELLETEPQPTRWLFRERMVQGRGVLISGLGGEGKTNLLYYIAAGVATRKMPWSWDVAITGKSLLFLTEDTPEDVQTSIHAVCRGLSEAETDQVKQSLLVYAMAGKECKLLVRGHGGRLTTTDLFHGLEAKVKEIGAVFVGIDPALSVTEGDENDQGDQRALGKMVDDLAVRTGATVALISHASKNHPTKDELSSHTSRGAGAITDVVRAEYVMRGMTRAEAQKAGITDIEERKRHVQLAATKGNKLPPSAYVPVWLRRGDGNTFSEAEIVFGAGGGPNKTDKLILEELRGLYFAGNHTRRELLSRCVERGIIKRATPEANAKALDRSLAKLKAAGLVEDGAGWGVFIPVEKDEEWTRRQS